MTRTRKTLTLLAVLVALIPLGLLAAGEHVLAGQVGCVTNLPLICTWLFDDGGEEDAE